MRRALTLLVTLGLTGVLAGAAGAALPRTIAIVGSSTSGGIVTVKVKIGGWKLYPARVGKKPNAADGGHWHIFVDGKYNNFAATTTGRTLKLAPGSHTIRAELANNDHSSLKPRVQSGSVTVTIAAATTPAPPAATTAPAPTTTAPPATTTAGGGGNPYGY